MTTQERLEESLIQNGMFKSQAEKVIEIAKKKLKSLPVFCEISWGRPASEYPVVIHTSIFLKIKPIALKWYEENLPNAWNKPMFQD